MDLAYDRLSYPLLVMNASTATADTLLGQAAMRHRGMRLAS